MTDWHVETFLSRSFIRVDDRHMLILMLTWMTPSSRWLLEAREYERGVANAADPHRAVIDRLADLPKAIAAADLFGRRWLEHAPGTSIATYVERPKAESLAR